MKTNEQLLSKLEQAFKSITVSDLNGSVLAPQKFDSFVRVVQEGSNILQNARFIEMDSQIVEIDRVGFSGRILKSGTDTNGADRTLADGEEAKPTFGVNKLTAVELQAITGIKDTALRRNIEREGFEDTLVDMFAEAAGQDLEEFAILADDDITYAQDDVLSLTDGWAKLAANKIYGQGAGADFDPAKVEELFDSLIAAVPKKYIRDRGAWRIYVTFEQYEAYREVLAQRGTALGDAALTGDIPLNYKGFLVEYAPMLERSKPVGENGAGRLAMLQHPDNMAWGLFHQIFIEPDRKPRARKTDYVLTLEGDANYEDENAAAVAFLDQEEPA